MSDTFDRSDKSDIRHVRLKVCASAIPGVTAGKTRRRCNAGGVIRASMQRDAPKDAHRINVKMRR
jgi:hypothetical protein